MSSRPYLAAACCAALASAGYAQTLAFPEAEGFGRFATGARTSLASASVYHVTNLNDSGAGSFRDAVSQPNRFVVFDVGGIANLGDTPLTFAANLTIAGQTAPGGFSVYGNRAAFHGADNLVSRYWGVRLGTAQGRVDAASMVRGQNMMFDHMSITWGVDGTFDINPDSGAVIDNLTIQNSIVAQGLDAVGHSTGGLMTLGEGRRFSIIKSLFADNVTRNPKVRGENEFINNVVYGYQTSGYIMGDTAATSNANVEGNYFIEGPVDGSSPFASGTNTFHLYAADNWVDANRDGVLNGALHTSYPGADLVAARHNFPAAASMSAQQALQFVLGNVGLSITRDAVDARLVQEVSSYGTLGGVIERESDLFPGYGTDAKYLNPRARLADADNDGMPDNWESSRGLNPASSADWKNVVGGYAQLEHYLNELGGYNRTRNAAAGGAWTTPATWGGAVPTFADTAVATGGVTHASGFAFARQLTLDGSSTVSGGTLDVFDTALVGASANGTLTLGGGTVSAGQVVLGSAGRTGTLVLNGGTLQTGTIASGGGTAGLTLNGGTIRATGAPNIAVPTAINAGGGTVNTNGLSGAISGNLTGTGPLTKSGAGALTLSGSNAGYSGPIGVTTGTLVLATDAAKSSTGTITLSNATTLNVTATGASTPMALAAGATATLSAGGLTYNGAISGPTGTTLVISTTTSGNFSINGNLSGFNGTFDLGTSTGNVRFGGTGSSSAAFDLGDATAALRTTFDATVNLGSLVGGANTRLQGSTNGTVATTWVIGGRNASTTFAGAITDGVNATTPGVTNVTKTGTGTLTLTSAALAYTGTTAVSNGTLRINGTHLGGDTYTIATGGTLGGSGKTDAPVAVQSGGKIAPGTSAGTLSVGNLTMAGGSILNAELVTASSYDQLNVTGTVDVSGAQLAATLSYAPATGSAVYLLKNDGTDAITGAFAGLPEGATLWLTSAANQTAYAFRITYVANAEATQPAGGNDVALISVIPEPGTLGCFGFGVLGLIARRR